VIIPAMNGVRVVADELETQVGREYWPFPTYADLLFNV
jgi:glutamine synthetase